MRKVATLQVARDGVTRCILFASSDGVYVFPLSSHEDGSSAGDFWFEDVESAEGFCRATYGIEASDWKAVPDPLPGCQADWMAPVRIKGRTEGRPQWRVLERLDGDGVWRVFKNDSAGFSGKPDDASPQS